MPLRKLYIYGLCIIIYSFFPVHFGVSEEKHIELSLKECIDRALKENLNFKSSYFGMHVDELSVTQAESEFDPSLLLNLTRDQSKMPTFFDYYKVTRIESKSTQLNITLGQNLWTGADWGVGFYNTLSESNIEREKNYTSNLGFQINQPLLKGFGKKINYSNIYIARLFKEATIYDIENNASELIYNVQNAYWNLVYNLQTLQVRELSLSQADSLLAYNEKGFELGILTVSDVLEAKSARLLREQEVLDLENQIRASEDVLRRFLNLTTEEDWHIRIMPMDNPEIPEITIDTETFEAKALELRPEYKIAQKVIEQNKLRLALSENNMSPGLDLTARYRINGSGKTYSKNLRDFSDVDEYGWNVGLMLSYPLRNRSARAEYEKRQIAIKRADLSLEDIKSMIVTEIRSSIRNVQNFRERIDVASLAVEVNKLKLKKEEEKFRNQLSTSFYVLQFQTDLANAQNLYNKALVDYTIAIAGLQKAKGTLLQDMNITIISEE